MRYKQFTFRNFKGIEEMTLSLDGDVTTLIGLNESGKTTILEAIFCFSYGAEHLDAINPTLASLRNPDQWIPISKRANFNDTIKIQAVISLDVDDKRMLSEQLKEQHGLTVSQWPDEISITENYRFADSNHTGTNRLWKLDLEGRSARQKTNRKYAAKSAEWQAAIDAIKEHLPRIWYFPNFLFELPDRFELVNDAAEEELRDRDAFYRSTFRQILTSLGYNANLQTHLIDRLHSEKRSEQKALEAVLLDMGRAVTKTIIEGWNRIFGRAPTAQEIELDAGSDAESPAFLELKIKGPDGYYDLSERSLGFRWFFMFLLMTSYQGGPVSGQKPLFLLDEPASNLHSSAQAELLKSFERLLDRCSLVYTTHSHHLINLKWLDSAYVVKNAALGSLDMGDYLSAHMGSQTSVGAVRYRQFVAEHPDQESYFQPVLDLLEYRPSVLEPVPKVVLVEGKSDFFLLRYMIDVIGVGGDVRTVPGGGAGALDPLIRLHIGWGTGFVVLLDGDKEGQSQRTRYEAEFGPFVADRCVLLPDACGDRHAIAAETLLTKEDIESILDAVYQPGVTRPTAKKALRNAVIELVARGEAVPIEQVTKDRFANLVGELNRRLVVA